MSKNEKMKSLSVKLSNLDNSQIQMLNKWLDLLKKDKKSINGELQKILFTHLENVLLKKEFENTLNVFQNSIFYAFRKSIFASLSPYQSNVKFWIEKLNIEIGVVNKKLDLILNLLSSSAGINLNSPKEKMLEELDVFERQRDEQHKELLFDKEREREENEIYFKTFENFKEVAFDSEKEINERMVDILEREK